MYTHKQFLKLIEKINPDIEVKSKYTKMQDRVKVRCKSCGKVWNPLAYSLKEGKGCPHCSAVKGSKNHNEKLHQKLMTFLLES